MDCQRARQSGLGLAWHQPLPIWLQGRPGLVPGTGHLVGTGQVLEDHPERKELHRLCMINGLEFSFDRLRSRKCG